MMRVAEFGRVSTQFLSHIDTANCPPKLELPFRSIGETIKSKCIYIKLNIVES